MQAATSNDLMAKLEASSHARWLGGKGRAERTAIRHQNRLHITLTGIHLGYMCTFVIGAAPKDYPMVFHACICADSLNKYHKKDVILKMR